METVARFGTARRSKDVKLVSDERGIYFECEGFICGNIIEDDYTL